MVIKYAQFVIFLLVLGQTNVLSNLNPILNTSAEKSPRTSIENDDKPHPPPLVQVIHGKVNSVMHDTVGSIDDVSPLVTEVLKPRKEFVVQTQTSILSGVVENENATTFETILDQAVLRSAELVENSTLGLTPLFVPDEKAPKELEPDVPINGSEKAPEESPIPELKPTPEPVKVPEQKVAEPAAPPPEIKPPDGAWDEKNTTHDDIPSFSEWAKKQMAEVGKNKGENLTVGTLKLRGKNYASPDCGAKVVASNPEALSPGAILSPSRDDYMLNPCNVKIWFVVELCESIQPQRVEIANFELFSSSPQDLSIYVSDRYPTRDWSQVATVQAKDERIVQTFSLPQLPNFAKYIKVELHSHYGSEHYCPISLFKAFGASELEVLDHDDAQDDGPVKAMIDEDESDDELTEGERGDFLAPVKAAVMHVVQKAAEVLVVKGGKRNNTCSNITLSKDCCSPGFAVLCTNCSEQFYDRLFDVMCCQGGKLKSLLLNPFVHSVLVNSSICSSYGFSWFNETCLHCSSARNAIGMSYMNSFFGNETIAALCNYLAVTEKSTGLRQDKLPDVAPLSVDQPQPSSTDEDPILATSLIHPTKTLPEENITAPETKPNQTLVLGGIATNETVKNEETPSQVEATPPLDVEQVQTKEMNDTLLTNTTAQDFVVQPASSQDEPAVTVDSLALDSLFPELEEEQTQDAEASTAKATMNLKVQKESVFVRLSNRIKALEVNMSLSSQYLEELSRRYKKQVEELQRSLANMMEEIKLSAERERALNSELVSVSNKVETLTETIEQLLQDQDGWGHKAYFYGHHGVIIAVEVIMLFVCIGLCKWLTSGSSKSIEDAPNTRHLPLRRHSLDVVTIVEHQPIKQRRPSEEAFIPSSSTHQDLLIDGAKRKISREQIRRKKKKKKDRSDESEIVTIGSGGEELVSESQCLKSCCTAQWAQQRTSAQTQTSSSQETLSSIQQPTPTSLAAIKKKTGAFKKIVKKLF